MEFNEIEHSICDVSQLWKRMFNAAMKEIGLSNSERRTLVNIKRFPGITQIELARKLDIEPQNILRVLDRLEEKQWIEKKQDPNDRRAKRIYTTLKAAPILERIFNKATKLHNRVLNSMSPQEVNACHEILNKIKARLTEELELICEEKKTKVVDC